MEAVNSIYNSIVSVLSSMGSYAPILACFLILIESILPILPLFVFITINFVAFGHILGFIISWICTIIGCMLAYWLTKRISNKKIDKLVNEKPNINKAIQSIKKMNLSYIVLILAVPFTPAFAINIAAGITNMPAKKYLIALALGKLFLVYFWGYIGTSLIESIQNPYIIIKVIIMLVFALILSKIVEKIVHISD